MAIIRKSALSLMALSAVMAACSSQPPRKPPQEPEPARSILTSCETEAESPDLERISTSLGYAFSPRFIPDGFEHSSSTIDRRRRANLVYQDGQGILLIAYPVEFFMRGSPTMVELGLIQPADAISDVSVSGRGAHVMRGGWSENTILAGPGINPADARWDYERSLTLYFDCETEESQVVGVAVQSIPDAAGDLISEADLIQVASSIRQRQ